MTTPSQRDALQWLIDRGGDGVFTRHGVLLAKGELAPVMRRTWEALEEAGKVELYGVPPIYAKNRLRVIA